MSSTTGSDVRPWHGHDNPFEALFQHIETKTKGQATSEEVSSLKAEIAALEQRLAPAVPAKAAAAPKVEAIAATT